VLYILWPYKTEEQEIADSFKKIKNKKRKREKRKRVVLKKEKRKERYKLAESLLLHSTVLRGLVHLLCTRSLSNLLPGHTELLLASLLCIATRAYTPTYTFFSSLFIVALPRLSPSCVFPWVFVDDQH
jgi:hypothetical protein